MSAKIIHSQLQNHAKVKTFSKGDEPNRRVVIALKITNRILKILYLSNGSLWSLLIFLNALRGDKNMMIS